MLAKRKAFSVSSVCAVLIAIMGLVMAFGSTARVISSTTVMQKEASVDGGQCRWRPV
jgi:hypothetical protein